MHDACPIEGGSSDFWPPRRNISLLAVRCLCCSAIRRTSTVPDPSARQFRGSAGPVPPRSSSPLHRPHRRPPRGAARRTRGSHDPVRPPPNRSLVDVAAATRSEEHTSELPSLMRISYDVFCLQNKNKLSAPH